ncbi:MAG: helix-hairpin-helix domain-containing protein [Candidatus Omnitrophica bacterium]|nr:helix-hairpin-helix domain-containing protein [Candidatus Omnitrophota bacterium]
MIKFTKDEKIAILFLLAVLFIGSSVFYCKKTDVLHKMALSAFNPTSGREPLAACLPNASRRQGREGATPNITAFGKVDINRATRDELVRIKNIGPVLAGRIISYREKEGPFSRIEDIKRVKGIGEKKYEKIKDDIALE